MRPHFRFSFSLSPLSAMLSDNDIVNKPTLHAAPAHLRLGDRRLLWLMLGSGQYLRQF